MKKNDNILKSKKLWATIVIILAIVLEFLLANILKTINPVFNDSYIELLYYSSQIVSSFFVIGGLVIAVWQYYLSSKSQKIDLEITQVQRAIDLSEYYKDNILKHFPAIRHVFNNTDIGKIIEPLKIKDLKCFDTTELGSLLTESDIKQLQKIQKSPEFYEAIMDANDIYNLNFRFTERKTRVKNEHGQDEIKIEINSDSIMLEFMANILTTVLNNMEFFALHFKHKTADESVIYQSLHQSYIEIMPYLYYYISKQNTSPTEKLYTNVIWLYNRWKEKQKENVNELSSKSESFLSHGTIVGQVS